MNRSLILSLVLGALGLATAVPLGCGAGVNGTGGTGGSGASAPSAGSFDASSSGAFMSGSGGSCNSFSCTADLHKVIDCNGTVIKECPADQGCSPDGTCVAACTSAELNKSTIGCDFYSVTPAVITESRGSCFAVTIANTWTSPISIQADYAGQTIDASSYTYIPSGQGTGLTYQPLPGGMLPPGQVGILFLSQYPSGDIFQVGCPVPSALNTSSQISSGTYEGDPGVGNAFHIVTTAPIVAYDVYPWGGASSFVSSATLLVPTPTWGTNFVTADGWGPFHGYPFTQIVAAQDGTTVTMVPVVDVQGGNGAPSGAANAPMTFGLNKGQVMQFVQSTRLAGSVVQSDKPVSVWGGSTCMNIPDGANACDAGHQQLLPVQVLGGEYVGARYPNRGGDDNAPYMAVGMVDGTTLTYDPAPPPGAPATLKRGQVVTFFTGGAPFSVKSQDVNHPFYFAVYMTGGDTSGGNGDPEYVNVVTPEQFLNSYLFATDPTYANTSIVFVRKRSKDGTFKDVTLDCLGVLTGWEPVGTGGQYEMVRPMLVSAFQPNGTCNNGAHTATSAEPFGLTVWGYDQYASYGYPGGMSVHPINTVVVPPIPN